MSAAAARKAEELGARRAQAERLNARVAAAARNREALHGGRGREEAGGGQRPASAPVMARVWPLQEPAEKPAQGSSSAQRKQQVEMAPRVDPTALAEAKRAALAAAQTKRANYHPMRYRWRQAELMDVDGASPAFGNCSNCFGSVASS